MHLTIAQAQAYAAGMPLAEVLLMATTAADPKASLETMSAAVDTANTQLTAANAKVTELTGQVTTLTAEKTGAEAKVTEMTTERDTARSEAETLKSIVAASVTALSTGVGTTVDTSKMTATELVAKHAELQAQAAEKFKNVPVYDTKKPGMKADKTEAEKTREAQILAQHLASAKAIPII